MEKVYIGENFKRLLILFSLKKAEIARRVGCSTGYLSEIESNEKSPGAGFLFALNREFDVNINWLLTGEGTPRTEHTVGAVAEPTTAGLPPEHERPVVLATPEEKMESNVEGIYEFAPPVVDLKRKIATLEQALAEEQHKNEVLQIRLDQTERVLSLMQFTTQKLTKETQST